MNFPHRNRALQTNLLPDGHIVVFDAVTAWAHTLNPIAALVWEFADGQHNVNEVVQSLRSLGTSICITDELISNFVDELKNAGLIHEDSVRGACEH